MELSREQIINYYDRAVRAFAETSRQQALRHIDFLLSKGCDDVDILRVKAACTPDFDVAGAEDITAMFGGRHLWGELNAELLRAKYATNDPEQMRAFPYELKFTLPWDVTPKLTTVTDLSAAMAWVNISRGEYDRARQILDQVTVPTPIIKVVRALMFHQSQRWTDAIAVAQEFVSPPFLDAFDHQVSVENGEPAVNVQYGFLSPLISGTAWAYLGNNETATQLLEYVVQHNRNFPAIAAEAYRVLGLVARRGGDEDRAQQMFSAGLAVSTLPELSAAKQDPSMTLTVTSDEMINRRASYWDYKTEPSLESSLAAQAGDARAKLLAEASHELDRQIGMAKVKEQVEQVRNGVRFREEMKRRGMATTARSNHMVFSGPPGTGKTTIARVIAKILAGYGAVRTDHLEEATRKDLVSGFVSQTAGKTAEVLNKARGGVLFIDEAYSLLQEQTAGSKDNFGQEAIDQLLLSLEEDRDDLVVIIAGYEAQLQRFLSANEGLRSRFTTWIRFESYSPAELALIVEVHAKMRSSVLEEGAVAAVEKEIIQRLAGYEGADGRPLIDVMGNGRFARNVAERAETFREARLANTDLAALTDDAMMLLTTDDLVQAVAAISEEAL